MVKPIFLLMAMIFMLACNQQRQDQSTQTEAEEAITDSTSGEVATPEEESVSGEEDRFAHAGAIEVEIQDLNFAYDPFAKSIQEIMKTIGPHTIEKTPYENLHVENVVDTMIHVQFDNSSIDYFKSQDGQTIFITKAIITSPKIGFKKNIKVGMSINDFKAQFEELKDKSGFKIATIVGEDGLYVVTCSFENDALAQVDFTGFLD